MKLKRKIMMIMDNCSNNKNICKINKMMMQSIKNNKPTSKEKKISHRHKYKMRCKINNKMMDYNNNNNNSNRD
jgi:hypothetical protein